MLMISNSFTLSAKTVFVVLPNLYEAQKYYDGLSNLVGDNNVLFFPTDPVLTTLMGVSSSEFQNERLYTIRSLLAGDKYIVVTTQNGLKKRLLSVESYKNSVKVIKKDDEIKIDDLVDLLHANGYERNYIVEKAGEYSVRGGIVDIFTKENKYPYRLDFFGDFIEEIKVFDVDDQLSFDSVEQFNLMPLNELFYNDEIKEEAVRKINKFFKKHSLNEREQEKLEKDLESIENYEKISTLAFYIPFFNEQKTNILDFSKNHNLFIINKEAMRIDEMNLEEDLKAFEMSLGAKTYLEIPFQLDLDEILAFPHIEIDNLGLDTPSATPLGIKDVNDYSNNLELFYLDNKKKFEEYEVYIYIKYKPNFERVKEFLEDKAINLDKPNIHLINDEFHLNFIDPKEKLMVITDSHLISRKIRPKIRYRSVLNQSTKVRDVYELTPGDFVVHYEHGIARYLGLQTMDLTGVKRDYLQLQYANEESMYIPVDQIDMILKYNATEGHQPKLSRLGGKTWTKTKAKVKKQIKELSDKLLNIYAERELANGFEFDSFEEEKVFAEDFVYEETEDQKRAIIETLTDMESDKVMDRLICGDVGFGKTEVALRATFKAIMSGKQVAYLVPTTILARQHFYTFKERLDKFGANVALLSRFVSQKQVKRTLERLEKGLVDVVVGTHRLLSDDVKFKDLGLFIIDEEQRFGVVAKEKIKSIRVNVDTLTLTATPIPRTLQMSLAGFKELSTIDTPPMNRYPIQTYVIKRNKTLIKEAIEREIARGGQVFYLYNRVRSIEKIASDLQDLVPKARVIYAHGKMGKNKIENVITNFVDHEYDVLVATTIIETGIDIPNTNTIIIHDADRYGLSQLYQVRGRVGRSDKIAYAYLMYDPGKILTEQAKERLSAIEKFTELGSGFKIAMQDLTIRGAGDLLGKEQSGFIDSVGLDMYLTLLDEVVTGKEKKLEVNNEVFVSQHVAPEYINSDIVRIEIHKSVSKINNFMDVEKLKKQLIDRFGPIDQELILYMYEKLYKKQSYKMGVEKTKVNKNSVELIINKETSDKMDGMKLFELSNHFDIPVKLGYIRGKVTIEFDLTNETRHWLYLVNIFLTNYLN